MTLAIRDATEADLSRVDAIYNEASIAMHTSLGFVEIGPSARSSPSSNAGSIRSGCSSRSEDGGGGGVIETAPAPTLRR
jgi:hypothetical protein